MRLCCPLGNIIVRLSHFSGWLPIRLLHVFEFIATQWIFSTVSRQIMWFFWLGSCPVRCLLCCFWMVRRKSGWGICVLPCGFGLCFGFGDLPSCMWPTASMLQFLTYSFFSCKDRALERDRPNQRKKKHLPFLFCLPASLQWKRLLSTVWQHQLLNWHWAKITTDEIDAATKLLDKACQKLRGIPDVPPQRITDHTATTSIELHLEQLHNFRWLIFAAHATYSQRSTSSEELNAQMPLPTDDEYHSFQDQDQLQEH